MEFYLNPVVGGNATVWVPTPSKKEKKILVMADKLKANVSEAKQSSDKARGKTRVNLGWVFNRWRQLKEHKDIKNDAHLAEFLLDSFSPSYQTDGSMEKANPRKRKRSSSVRPQDEERTPALLNDDVWVNLRCLLQLFQECGRCRAVCKVNTQEDTSHFSVIQYCKACNHWVIWNSQPLKSTSTEDGEKKEDVQVPVSSPCDDGQGTKVTTGSETETASETEAWNEEHFMELEVNIDSDFSDELPLCKLEEEEEEIGEEEEQSGEEEEERGEEEEETGEEEEEEEERGEEEEEEEEGGEEEELVGQQSDEMHKDNVSQTEKHHTDAKETEKQIADSVRRTVEVKEEEEEVAIDSEVTEDDEWQGKEEDWSEEEQQAENSQTSDSDFEITKPTKRRRPRMRNIFENEGIETGAQEEEWQMDDDDDDEEEEEEWSSEEQKAHSKEMKLIRNRDRMKPVYLKRVYLTRSTQRLCPNCGVMYASQTHVCNDKKKFPCPKCGKRRLSELNVQAHIIHCKGLVFPCRFCLEPFQSKLDKVKHENRHQDTLKPYLCTKCPETFDDFFIRNRHLKEHEELTCRTCQKPFSVVHALRRHERSHLDDKPFKCHVCERAFAQGSQLKCHMRVHTGERPYKCQLCSLAFNHNISLKTHIRRYHQNESYPIGPQSHPDPGEQRVTPRGPSSASDPREQRGSTYIPSSDESLDSSQEPQPSRWTTEPGEGGEVHSMTVQERWKGEVAESVLEDQGGLTLQTQLDIAEGEGGGNACDSRPKRKRPRNRWCNSDFEWEGEKDS